MVDSEEVEEGARAGLRGGGARGGRAARGARRGCGIHRERFGIGRRGFVADQADSDVLSVRVFSCGESLIGEEKMMMR